MFCSRFAVFCSRQTRALMYKMSLTCDSGAEMWEMSSHSSEFVEEQDV